MNQEAHPKHRVPPLAWIYDRDGSLLMDHVEIKPCRCQDKGPHAPEEIQTTYKCGACDYMHVMVATLRPSSVNNFLCAEYDVTRCGRYKKHGAIEWHK